MTDTNQEVREPDHIDILRGNIGEVFSTSEYGDLNAEQERRVEDAIAIVRRHYDPLLAEARRAALASAPPPAVPDAVRVRVKRLTWGHHPSSRAYAHASSPFGVYRVVDYGDHARWGCAEKGSNIPNRAANMENAKAAAQADFDRRILSAIEPTPSPEPQAFGCMCRDVPIGSHKVSVLMDLPAHMASLRDARVRDGLSPFITVDACLVEEIRYLWSKGITTTGCCCGHNRAQGFIGVDPASIPVMKEMGYRVATNVSRPGDEDSFLPKLIRPEPQASNAGALATYDAGLLSDYGGGNVEWWQDYVRLQLAQAHEFYFDQWDALTTSEPQTGERDGEVETYHTIGLWADEAFGAATVLRRLERAGEELDEAKTADPGKVLEEIADVMICLAAAAHSHGGDLQAAINTKMAINRARKWAVRGDGTGYHIPASDVPACAALSTPEPQIWGRALERARIVSKIREIAKRFQPKSASANNHLALADAIESGAAFAEGNPDEVFNGIRHSARPACTQPAITTYPVLPSDGANLTDPQAEERDRGPDDLTAAYMAGFERGKDAERAAREAAERERDKALRKADVDAESFEFWHREAKEQTHRAEAAERRLAKVEERAREDERDRLMQAAVDSGHAVHWLRRNGAMLPADRATLRAKPEAQAVAGKEAG